jgi:DNA primase large subunit
VLGELEACHFRNRTPAETAAHMKTILDKYLPLSSNSSNSSKLHAERKKDHYSHFILRLAFSSTDDLRQRFARLEKELFRLRFQSDDTKERNVFVSSLDLAWEPLGQSERDEILEDLLAAGGYRKRVEQIEEGWFKVDWMRVPELVERRAVLLKAGIAYVPAREQQALVLAEFQSRLEKALLLTARALPRLDEDERLSPILSHLSSTFLTPPSTSGETVVGQINAASIPSLVQHMPLCMSTLTTQLQTTHHLKHYARLQLTLFLKGIGLSLPDALIFWRQGFSTKTDDEFNKEYKYNVRHAYGDVGGGGNRTGGGYSPFGCQKILTEHQPGVGESHGCPYRHYSVDNLVATLQRFGVNDREVIAGVKQDREKMKFHMACNRVFEHAHARELREAKDRGVDVAKETIVHPNEYFKRSYILRNLGKNGVGEDGKVTLEMES